MKPMTPEERLIVLAQLEGELPGLMSSHFALETWRRMKKIVGRDLENENERLRTALEDALEGMEDMVGYVSDYFREKWGHDDYIARAKDALSR